MKLGQLYRAGILACLMGMMGLGAFGATNTVIVGTYFFNPTNITVAQGDTIIWKNNSTIVHDSTQGTLNSPAGTRLWASPNLSAVVGSYAFTFTNTGVYPYVCLQHIATRPEQTGTVTVATGNFAPSVSMTSPSAGTRHPAPPNFPATATAVDPDGTVTNVLFTATATGVGTVVLGSVTSVPYSVRVTNLPPASYQFRAIATDNKGLSTTSATVGVLIALPVPLVLSNAVRTAVEQFQFDLSTTSGLSYVVEESRDLNGPWIPVSTNNAGGPSVKITRPFESLSPTQRLYRAFILP